MTTSRMLLLGLLCCFLTGQTPPSGKAPSPDGSTASATVCTVVNKELLKAGNVSLGEDDKYWILKSGQWLMRISKDSGLPHGLDSLKPTPLEVLARSDEAFTAYIKPINAPEKSQNAIEIKDDLGQKTQNLNFGGSKLTAYKTINLDLKAIGRIDLLADINCYNISGPYLDGGLTVTVNGHKTVLVPPKTRHTTSYGGASIDEWDGFSTFRNIPVSYFKKGRNVLEFSGSNDCYMAGDSQATPMVRLKLFPKTVPDSRPKEAPPTKRLLLNSLKSFSFSGGRDKSGRFIKLNCIVGSKGTGDPDVAEVSLQYVFYADRIDLKARFVIKKQMARHEIGFDHRYNLDKWEKNIYPCYPFMTVPRQENFFGQLQYANRKWDATTLDQPAIRQSLVYPMTVWQRNDRYVMYGMRDLGGFVVIRADNPNSKISFFVTPQKIKKGDTYSFDLTWKSFAKPSNAYQDVMGWYASNVYSSNPITKGIVALDRSKQRLPFKGNLVNYFLDASPLNRNSPPTIDEKALRELHLTNVWLIPWCPWNELSPTEGQWYTQDRIKMKAVQMREDIKQLQKRGFRVFLYFRQFLNTSYVFDDKPPYKKWMLRKKNGDLAVYITWKMTQPQTEKTIGTKGRTMTWVFADFGNDEFRNWYIDSVKKAVDYYNPDGVAWDMGWSDMNIRTDYGYSASNPQSGIHHGILRVFYEIYQWLGKNHPEKKVIANFAIANPGQLYVDATIVEGGIWGTPDIMYEAAQAFNCPLISMYYGGLFGGGPARGYNVMKSIALGSNLSVCAVELDKPSHAFIKTWKSLFDFSYQTSDIPLASQRRLLKVEPKDKKIVRSLWSKGKNEFYLALFNDEAKTVRIKVKFDVRLISGPINRKNFSCEIISGGTPRDDDSFNAGSTEDRIEIVVELKAYEMALISYSNKKKADKR